MLLGASAAQAATVICENDPAPCAEGESVIRIENLEVLDIYLNVTTLYNVDFVYDTAINVYGSGLETDFPTATNALAAFYAVTDALNANAPTPATAGSQDTDQFFIGSIVQRTTGNILAVGGQNISGVWDQCEADCVTGVAVLAPNQPFTYADFSLAEDGAPGQATLISPNGTITDNTPTYTWNAVATASFYFLQVNDSAANPTYQWYPADEANCGDGTRECSVTPETELADGTYNWRIQAWNEFGIGPWSDPLYFSVDTTGPDPSEIKVILDENGNVRRIENLPVLDENTGTPTVYNVDFVYDTAYSVYGSNLEFDFPDDETSAIALEAVTDALNANEPIPLGAGPEGSTQFFIGADLENDFVAAVGGELIFEAWDQCETDCLLGVTILAPSVPSTYADFEKVEAGSDVVQVFLTLSMYRGGTLGGLAGADASCQDDAEDAGLTGTWTAWLSDDTNDARDRIPDGRYELLDQTVIAEDKDDLTDGLLNAPININEYGDPGVGQVWTGTKPNGTAAEDNCDNWTNQSADADFGTTDNPGPGWTSFVSTGSAPTDCGAGDFKLYCFGGGQ
jgi:hypothetical protein